MNLVLAFNFIPPILNLPVHVSLGGAGLTHQGTIRANDALKTENTLGDVQATTVLVSVYVTTRYEE